VDIDTYDLQVDEAVTDQYLLEVLYILGMSDIGGNYKVIVDGLVILLIELLFLETKKNKGILPTYHDAFDYRGFPHRGIAQQDDSAHGLYVGTGPIRLAVDGLEGFVQHLAGEAQIWRDLSLDYLVEAK
jgi:hypothetical protein